MRKSLVIGNWKMHGSCASVDTLLEGLSALGGSDQVGVVLCPPYVFLPRVLSAIDGLSVGAQDCSAQEEGAYTGEVSATMLADLGCNHVILGHSERRQYHAESDRLIGAKLSAAVSAGLAPVLCVGETRQQRESGEAEEVVAMQLLGALESQASLDSLIVAYEPVWAIGTGLTATAEQAQAMHGFIRERLQGLAGLQADSVPVLYGGSVKANNAAELFAQPDIDGALVGGASLDATQFAAIVAAAVAQATA